MGRNIQRSDPVMICQAESGIFDQIFLGSYDPKLIYSKRQNNLSFTISPLGDARDFCKVNSALRRSKNRRSERQKQKFFVVRYKIRRILSWLIGTARRCHHLRNAAESIFPPGGSSSGCTGFDTRRNTPDDTSMVTAHTGSSRCIRLNIFSSITFIGFQIRFQ